MLGRTSFRDLQRFYKVYIAYRSLREALNTLNSPPVVSLICKGLESRFSGVRFGVEEKEPGQQFTCMAYTWGFRV